MDVEHHEAEILSLHSDVHQSRILLEDDTHVKILSPQAACAFQLQSRLQEGKVMHVACTHNNGVKVLFLPVFKSNSFPLYFGQDGKLLYLLRELLRHWPGPIGN